MKDLQKLVTMAGPSLTELGLDHEAYVDSTVLDSTLNHLELYENINLESCFFCAGSIRTLHTTISTITSASLTDIHIRLELTFSEWKTSASDWDDIDRFFSSSDCGLTSSVRYLHIFEWMQESTAFTETVEGQRMFDEEFERRLLRIRRVMGLMLVLSASMS